MRNTSERATIVNYILSGIAWLLSLLTLLFNICGLWKPWHLAGYGFILYVPVAFIAEIITIIICLKAEEHWYTHKYIIRNTISLPITVVATLLTLFVSQRWFW